MKLVLAALPALILAGCAGLHGTAPPHATPLLHGAPSTHGAAPKSAAPDGGATVTFRQTFEEEAAGKVRTTLTRREGDAWLPTFPGSEDLLMTPRG